MSTDTEQCSKGDVLGGGTDRFGDHVRCLDRGDGDGRVQVLWLLAAYISSYNVSEDGAGKWFSCKSICHGSMRI